ncbi:MAG: choice-of-anchor Q domain-containing protein [bacterium]
MDSTSNLQRNAVGNIFLNPASGDYRLTRNSPAKDAGMVEYARQRAPFDDCNGAVRPQGSGYDIGAYEN